MPLDSDIDKALDALTKATSALLLAAVISELTTIYLAGANQMDIWAKLDVAGPPPTKEAIAFAREQGAKLVTQMNEETKRRLAGVISDGIKNKRGIPGIARDIRNTFGDMTKFRAELIARTETANALGEAFMVRGKDLGVTGKEWVTVGDDRVSLECQDNEMAGAIPINQAFPTGVMTVPQHPGCRCAVAPVML